MLLLENLGLMRAFVNYVFAYLIFLLILFLSWTYLKRRQNGNQRETIENGDRFGISRQNSDTESINLDARLNKSDFQGIKSSTRLKKK